MFSLRRARFGRAALDRRRPERSPDSPCVQETAGPRLELVGGLAQGFEECVPEVRQLLKEPIVITGLQGEFDPAVAQKRARLESFAEW